MRKITVKVDGMMCGMCESHINDAIRRAFPIQKVTSSHTKGETVILCEQEIDEMRCAPPSARPATRRWRCAASPARGRACSDF